jgi:hypothetical protein
VQKQIVAVEFCKAVRSKKKIEIAVCSKDFWSIFDERFFFTEKTLNKYNSNLWWLSWFYHMKQHETSYVFMTNL